MKEIPLSLDYSRLCQCISMGLRSGLPPELCMELSKTVISRPELCEKLDKAYQLLSQGQGFVESITQAQLFAAMELRMISLGVQAGSADEVIGKLAERYEEKSLSKIAHIVSVLEPTIVIVLSLLVGMVLLSVMMPLLGLLSEMIA